jgi:GNAT superfamily N-acetyltransferase
MSGTPSVHREPTPTSGWQVRSGRPQDAEAIAGAIADLLLELGATPPNMPAMIQVTRALLEEPAKGALLVADVDGTLIGVVSASWQTAIHVPGSYGLIQDLWVDPSWRGKAIGANLIEELLEHAATIGITQLEVGLPRESFPGVSSTRSFYEANGFAMVGARMRRILT